MIHLLPESAPARRQHSDTEEVLQAMQKLQQKVDRRPVIGSLGKTILRALFSPEQLLTPSSSTPEPAWETTGQAIINQRLYSLFSYHSGGEAQTPPLPNINGWVYRPLQHIHTVIAERTLSGKNLIPFREGFFIDGRLYLKINSSPNQEEKLIKAQFEKPIIQPVFGELGEQPSRIPTIQPGKYLVGFQIALNLDGQPQRDAFRNVPVAEPVTFISPNDLYNTQGIKESPPDTIVALTCNTPSVTVGLFPINVETNQVDLSQLQAIIFPPKAYLIAPFYPEKVITFN